ncbi:MAG: phosphomethylpyrimidine synthase ThiC [bacterium]
MNKILKIISSYEKVSEKYLKYKISKGEITILFSNKKNPDKTFPVAVGRGLFIKINANIGTSEKCLNLKLELAKLKIAQDSGADTIMDLSTGGNIRKIRQEIIALSRIPVGTVPLYEAFIQTGKDKLHFKEILFNVIKNHIDDGVDFLTLHTGINKKILKLLKKNKRVTGIVSRGGALLLDWMEKTGEENPMYQYFDELLTLMKNTGVAISLGDGCRPGAIADATDTIQIEELKNLGKQVLVSRKNKIKVLVEGPGHIPINQIKKNIDLQKKLCFNAPFYVLGPIVTDIAPGYDHITSAIGAAFAGFYGADYICYVTPSEHLGLPSIEDVKNGVIAAKIAAHAIDIAKGKKEALKRDYLMSKARKCLDWTKQKKYSIDPEKFENINKDTCSMCGKYCSMKLMNKIGI